MKKQIKREIITVSKSIQDKYYQRRNNLSTNSHLSTIERHLVDN